MYIIVTCLLKTCEISHRSTFKTRTQARKNLLKEAQNWLSQTKPNNEWEIITHKKDVGQKRLPFFIKASGKNEDVLSVYERVDTVQKGWIVNSTSSQLVKIITFSVVDITGDEEETVRYITSPVQEKTILTDSDKKIMSCQKSLLTQLKTNLAERRIFIE